MWWLIGSAPDLWGRGHGLESGISHNDPEAQQDHCVEKCRKTQRREGNLPIQKKKIPHLLNDFVRVGSLSDPASAHVLSRVVR